MSGELKISDLEAELAHYGVPGMKWGRRKTPTSAERTRHLEKQLTKLSGQQIVRGAGMSGWAVGKGKKNPGSYAKKNITARGAVEVATILGGGALLMKAAKIRNPRGAMISVGLLAGAAGYARLSEINAVKQYEKSVKIHEELGAIRKADKKKS